jgi:hypothetical protein
MSAGLRGFNRPFMAGAGDGLAALITVIALLPLVPTVGLMGAAIASLLGHFANFVFNVWICRRFGIPTRELLAPTGSDLQFVRGKLRQGAAAAWTWLIQS